jgi:dTDP-glucose pyrophosphorylase
MQLNLLYRTDAWHSNKVLLGVYTDYKKMIKAIDKIARSEDVEITDHDLYLLNTIQQTQSYEGDGEFLYEIIESNTLL